MNFVYVALGGAVGAIGRYAISLMPTRTEFPILTLITNLIGAVLIGFIVGFIDDRDEASKNMLLFWKTGVCGSKSIREKGILCWRMLFDIERLWMCDRSLLWEENSNVIM